MARTLIFMTTNTFLNASVGLKRGERVDTACYHPVALLSFGCRKKGEIDSWGKIQLHILTGGIGGVELGM